MPKSVVKYVVHFAHCPECRYYYAPPAVKRLRGQLLARSFRCWTTYLRVELRLPLRVISRVFEAVFSEHVSPSVVGQFVSTMAQEYGRSEEVLLERILASHVIHSDETMVNIRGVGHYAWVLTDGRRVVFKPPFKSSMLAYVPDDMTNCQLGRGPPRLV